MKRFFKVFISFIMVLLIIISLLKVFERFITEKEIQIKVTKLEAVKIRGGEELFFIHTRDEVFENRNDYYHNKSNMVELYKQLKKNHVYRVIVVGYGFGFKLPFLSDKRNIISIVKKGDEYKRY